MASDRLALTKSELLPDSQKSSGPDTLGGYLVEAVHNALSSPETLSAAQRKERDQHSDQLATVAADTVAMLPGMRASAAGLLRATALTHINGSATDIAGNYAKDFLEGAALNKIATNCLPEGALGQKIQSSLGKGLLAESASFAVLGAGMGSVTTAFRPETWLDQNKNFSLVHGAKETALAGTIGGALAVPAGLIASRASKAALALGAEGRISQSSALALSGLGSGYLSGSIVGGVQGYAAGGDFNSFLRGASEGGLAGALSGSIGLAAMARFSAPKAEQASRESFAKNSVEKTPQEKFSTQKSADELWDSLEIKRAKLDDSETTLKDRVARLSNPRTEQLNYWIAAENADQIAANSKTFEEFQRNGGFRSFNDTVRVYNVGRNTITIPETYARKLDEVLNLRLWAAEDPQLYTMGPDFAAKVEQARIDLDAHPLKLRAHPADFVQLLDELPDRSLVKDLLIREDRAHTDAWNAKEYEKGFKAAATAGKEDGRITVYAQDRSPLLREYMKHEFGHLLKWNWIGESGRFDQAAALEKDGYFVSKYSRKNVDENWAEHFASLLDPDPDKFLDTAHGAPLRTVEMTTALLKSIGNASGKWPGTHGAELSRRIDYVQKYIIPEAQMQLGEIVKAGETERAVPAIRLLGRIAGKEDFQFLAEQAKTQGDPEIRKAAFQAGWAKLTDTNGYGVDSRTRVEQMRNFLLGQSETGAKSRISALELLSRMRDPESRFYQELLTLNEGSGNRLSRTLELMDRAPDNKGLRLAWKEALKAVGDKPDDRVNLALRALDRYEAVVEDAVAILAKEAQARTAPFLQELSEHFNSRVADKAAEGLRQIEFNTKLEAFNKAQSIESTPEKRIEAANALAATHNPRAATPLLDAYARAANDQERQSIASALKKNITPEIWKFELRYRKQSSPETAALFRNLMN